MWCILPCSYKALTGSARVTFPLLAHTVASATLGSTMRIVACAADSRAASMMACDHSAPGVSTSNSAFRVNDHLMPAAADRFADQAMIVALAVAGRCVGKIGTEIE